MALAPSFLSLGGWVCLPLSCVVAARPRGALTSKPRGSLGCPPPNLARKTDCSIHAQRGGEASCGVQSARGDSQMSSWLLWGVGTPQSSSFPPSLGLQMGASECPLASERRKGTPGVLTEWELEPDTTGKHLNESSPFRDLLGRRSLAIWRRS